MKVEITVEQTRRTSKVVEVTEDQLQELKGGINPFYMDMEKEIDNGNVEWDYTVNDLDGKEIVPWN